MNVVASHLVRCQYLPTASLFFNPACRGAPVTSSCPTPSLPALSPYNLAEPAFPSPRPIPSPVPKIAIESYSSPIRCNHVHLWTPVEHAGAYFTLGGRLGTSIAMPRAIDGRSSSVIPVTITLTTRRTAVTTWITGTIGSTMLLNAAFAIPASQQQESGIRMKLRTTITVPSASANSRTGTTYSRFGSP